MDIENFTGRAEAYAKGRPGYPQAAIDQIVQLAPKGAVFADVGAGTGKFTVELAKRGYFVNAVEPNADMRKQLQLTLSQYSNVKIIDGSDKDTKLLDQSIDILTVAHALHWFDRNAFLKECHRVVKPGGWLIAIYNHVPGDEMTDFCKQAVDEFFTDPITYSFPNPIIYTKENWLAYIASQDGNPLPGESGYEAFIQSLSRSFDQNSVNGLLHCDRLTKIYCQKVE